MSYAPYALLSLQAFNARTAEALDCSGCILQGHLRFDPTGPAWPKGDPEADGSKGDTGAQGISGAQGSKGDTGDKGDIGPQGLTVDPGPKGDKAASGLARPPGPKGDTGTIGNTGSQGAKGETGSKGDAGSQGQPGIAGPKGLIGDIGISGYEIVTNTSVTNSFGFKETTANCPGTKQVIGGGTFINTSSSRVATLDSRPTLTSPAG